MYEFQCQTGSIKAQSPLSGLGRFWRFQCQTGSIKAGRGELERLRSLEVSMPDWFD